ncbi:ribose-phosphate pyrophosphokinase 5 [Diutina catenulata]
MRDLVVLSGSSHPELTQRICRHLTLEQGEAKSSKFANGETSVEIGESVREKDVFIVQSGCGHVNDTFIELLIMLSACKSASARRVTAVLPLFPYSRQPDIPHLAAATGAPKKQTFAFESRPGTPKPSSVAGGPETPAQSISETPSVASTNSVIAPSPLRASSSSIGVPSPHRSGQIATTDAKGQTESGYRQWIAQNGTLIANLLMCAGAGRIITMDLHDPQFQGYFDISVDNLYSKPLLKHWIIESVPNYRECVIVSPDSGGAKRATALADALGCPFALIHKERRANQSATATGDPKVVATTMLVGDVRDKVCILVDDLVDTAYTITRAARLLKDQGASYVYGLVTHGIFSGDAVSRIERSDLDKVVVTNSVPVANDKFEVLDVSRVFAEAIRRIHNGESVSMLFDHGW